jgi:hypothetical protein
MTALKDSIPSEYFLQCLRSSSDLKDKIISELLYTCNDKVFVYI